MLWWASSERVHFLDIASHACRSQVKSGAFNHGHSWNYGTIIVRLASSNSLSASVSHIFDTVHWTEEYRVWCPAFRGHGSTNPHHGAIWYEVCTLGSCSRARVLKRSRDRFPVPISEYSLWSVPYGPHEPDQCWELANYFPQSSVSRNELWTMDRVSDRPQDVLEPLHTSGL